MPIFNLKHSLDFLKYTFKTGSPQQRKWAMEELKIRWEEMKPDEQLDLIFGIPADKKEVPYAS